MHPLKLTGAIQAQAMRTGRIDFRRVPVVTFLKLFDSLSSCVPILDGLAAVQFRLMHPLKLIEALRVQAMRTGRIDFRRVPVVTFLELFDFFSSCVPDASTFVEFQSSHSRS